MPGFIELMAHSRVSVSSPDGCIHAQMIGGKSLEFGFTSHSYVRYSPNDLGAQLGVLIGLVFDARAETRRIVLSKVVGEEVPVRKEHELSERERRFRRLRGEATAVGVSPDRAVRVKQSGPNGWQVSINPGIADSLSEAEFLAAFSRALSDVMGRYRDEVARARATVYGDDDLKRYR